MLLFGQKNPETSNNIIFLMFAPMHRCLLCFLATGVTSTIIYEAVSVNFTWDEAHSFAKVHRAYHR